MNDPQRPPRFARPAAGSLIAASTRTVAPEQEPGGMREKAEIRTHDCVALRGWLYRPQPDAPSPGVVMSHGLSATCEMGLADHAEILSEAGLAVLLYDHRALGGSDGEPRQLIDPFIQTRDMMDAVGWLTARPEVDAARISVWGTSLSGGEALVLGALDARVREVAEVIPFVGQPGAAATGDAEAWPRLARRMREATIDPELTVGPRAVVPGPSAPPVALMTDPDTAAWLLAEGGHPGRRWRNAVLSPARPADMPFDPAPALGRLHAPVLMIAGAQDRVTPAADARAAAALAGARAEIVVLEGHHCSFYAGEPLRAAAARVRDFLLKHL